ncbi:MAG: GNAT family N-acetyltransferase [Spirochaetales bacterium]|nr:GNAT family N-acetyltransferase [Spirochaetales bacterium]
MKLIIADTKNLDTLENLYSCCIEDLNSRGIFQWDHKYPNRETHAAAIKAQEQYLIRDGEILVGAVILNESQAEEWESVNWQYEGKAPLVIHALALSPQVQGKGYGKKVLTACEEFGRKLGYESIRLDVFPGNPAALRLYEKQGYIKRGEVSFPYKPQGHQEYHCYEKKL